MFFVDFIDKFELWEFFYVRIEQIYRAFIAISFSKFEILVTLLNRAWACVHLETIDMGHQLNVCGAINHAHKLIVTFIMSVLNENLTHG